MRKTSLITWHLCFDGDGDLKWRCRDAEIRQSMKSRNAGHRLERGSLLGSELVVLTVCKQPPTPGGGSNIRALPEFSHI